MQIRKEYEKALQEKLDEWGEAIEKLKADAERKEEE